MVASEEECRLKNVPISNRLDPPVGRPQKRGTGWVAQIPESVGRRIARTEIVRIALEERGSRLPEKKKKKDGK